VTANEGDLRHELALDLPSTHRGVRVARNVLMRFARMQGVPGSDADGMALVASELLANAIDHGGGGAALTEADLSSDVRMRMSLVVNATRWTLSVSDQGGADPEEIQRLLANAEDFDPEDDRGRGLFLLNTMVDELEIFPNDAGDGLTFRVHKGYGGDA
jgi:anti-sigma regulatory factor (Ser/Thr protein kinase)